MVSLFGILHLGMETAEIISSYRTLKLLILELQSMLREGSDHVIIRRNFIHDGVDDGITLTTKSGGGTGCSYWTIGGATGDGNVIKDVGVGTAMADIVLARANDIIVSYNHLYATKSDGLSTDRGIDGVVPMNASYNVLIEYNSIHGHQDAYYNDSVGCGSPCEGYGEDGIDIKDDNCGAGEME